MILRVWPILILLFLTLGSSCLAEGESNKGILDYGLAAICDHDDESALLFKRKLLEEAREGKFTGPAHSMKIKQTLAMYRGYYYLKVNELYPGLFSQDERDRVADWFVRITERTFTVEWSDIYYALAFRKAITAPYRNQENGTGALVVFAEIIRDKRPDLATKALDYVRNNAVMWKGNFRNTDDSISYQAVWIYNCYNVASLLHPEWLKNGFSKKSFDWLKAQWPPDGSPLGYNPEPDVLIPDIMYLGAHVHGDGTYKWLGDRMMEYASDKNMALSGFRPGMAFRDNDVVPSKPNIGSVYIKGPGGLVQFPSEDRPDKIVFREGWEPDDFYALLNLRFEGWHGYKGTNSFVSIRYGHPFVVEDLVKKSWDWLPKGRAKRRDANICRTRLNGFQMEGPFYRGFFNRLLGFSNGWEQDVPSFAEVEYFTTSEKIDASRTRISNWGNWNNTRICLLVKDDYFVVFDFNSGKKEKKHAVSWHLRGELNREGNEFKLRQGDRELSLFLALDSGDYILKSSSEPYAPEAEDLEADYDVWMQAASKHSEMVSLFWPRRGNEILSVRRLEDSSPHIMLLNIDTRDFQDILFVRDGRSEELFKYKGLEVDSDFVVVRRTGGGARVLTKSGEFVLSKEEETDQSSVRGLTWTTHCE